MADVQAQQDNANGQKNGQGKKRKRRGKGVSRKQAFKDKRPQVKPDYRPIVKDNSTMVKYYGLQPMFEEGEFDIFMNCLRETLPATFRINTFDIPQANYLKSLVAGVETNEIFVSPEKPKVDAEKCEARAEEEENGQDNRTPESQIKAAFVPLQWYPNQYAWQMNISRIDLRKSPVLQQLHKFMIAETDNGYISRQEAVSMIPPLLLDVKRGQNILDMCAAPGSKTAQLLEYLKIDIKNNKPYERSEGSEYFDDGMVVANDIDNKRCYMLVHQSSRLNSPNCVIINQDASRLPTMKTFNKDGEEHSDLKFDRILCDVPCSGDGTVRKNPDVWKKWTVGNANNFHGMQCKILRRGLELLKKNGLLVYSTCSMNPAEDEAVISSVLRASDGTISLVDVSDKLVELKRKPGLRKWIVMDNQAQVVDSPDKVTPELMSNVYPGLFPPTEEEANKFNLERCLRVFPHLQNTGAFFVALLTKNSDTLPWETLATDKNVAAQNDSLPAKPVQPKPNPKKHKPQGFKEDPFKFLKPDDPEWIAIKEVYGLCDDFPVHQLAHRCIGESKRTIYLLAKRTRSFILANEEGANKSDFVKIINAGMRLFCRANTGAGYRICQDGVSEILPYIKDDIKVSITKDDLVALLQSRGVPFDNLSEAKKVNEVIRPGSFILMYKHVEAGEAITMPLVAWKGHRNVALYVSNTYRVHLRALAQLRLCDEDARRSEPEKVSEEVVQEQ